MVNGFEILPRQYADIDRITTVFLLVKGVFDLILIVLRLSEVIRYKVEQFVCFHSVLMRGIV